MYTKLIALDHAWTAALQGWPSTKLRTPMQAITTLGSPVVTTCVVLLVTVLGWRQHNYWLTTGILAAYIAQGVEAFLKLIIRRPRPNTYYAHHMWLKTYSFPSGHAFGTTTMYGFLAYVLATQTEISFRDLGAMLIGTLIFLIGYSRVYLGAHYVLDVVAGWGLGVGVLFLVLISLPH